MRRVVVVAIALAVPFLSRADNKPTADEAARAELKALSGTWVAAGGEAKGVGIPKDELPFRLTFRAGGKAVFADRKQGGESTFAYTIDASKTPRAIDFTYEGPVADLKDASQSGIFKVEGDTLTICLTLPGATEKDRPTGFGTKEGRLMLMRLERAKDGK